MPFASSLNYFNPRPRAGGDTTMCWMPSTRENFNPRPRAGGDVIVETIAATEDEFQSTPPRRGRRLPRPRCQRPAYFNPRPRAGGDPCRKFCADSSLISIHAPAQGATSPYDWTFRAGIFQSTPPRRGRRGHPLRRGWATCISIHAPAQGATPDCSSSRTVVIFQSTPPRRGRRRRAAYGCAHGHFNPRPRAGGDGRDHRPLQRRQISIHAPAQGAT